jgi:hypothetical protein
MQHAGKMAQEYRKLMGKDAAPQQKTLDDYLQWANLVLRTAALTPARWRRSIAS